MCRFEDMITTCLWSAFFRRQDDVYGTARSCASAALVMLPPGLLSTFPSLELRTGVAPSKRSEFNTHVCNSHEFLGYRFQVRMVDRKADAPASMLVCGATWTAN